MHGRQQRHLVRAPLRARLRPAAPGPALCRDGMSPVLEDADALLRRRAPRARAAAGRPPASRPSRCRARGRRRRRDLPRSTRSPGAVLAPLRRLRARPGLRARRARARRPGWRSTGGGSSTSPIRRRTAGRGRAARRRERGRRAGRRPRRAGRRRGGADRPDLRGRPRGGLDRRSSTRASSGVGDVRPARCEQREPATPRPIAVMIDADGAVLVADAAHPRLLRFDAGWPAARRRRAPGAAVRRAPRRAGGARRADEGVRPTRAALPRRGLRAVPTRRATAASVSPPCTARCACCMLRLAPTLRAVRDLRERGAGRRHARRRMAPDRDRRRSPAGDLAQGPDRHRGRPGGPRATRRRSRPSPTRDPARA